MARGRADPAHARPRRRDACAGSARSSSCTSSRAARSSTCDAAGRRRRRRSGRTAAGGSTSPARPTTPAPRGWPTAHDPMLDVRRRRPGGPRGGASGAARSPPSARCAVRARTPSTRSRRGSRAWLDARAADRRRWTTLRRRSSPTVGTGRPGRHDVASTGVVDAGDRVRRRAARPAGRACSADAPGAADRRRATTPASWPRRRADRDALRPQPDRRLALPGRARRARRLRGRRRGARPTCSRTSRAVTTLLVRARLARRRPVAGRARRRRRRPDHRGRAPAPTPAPGDDRLRRRSSCPGSPTRTRTPSTARCAGAPTTGGGTFWTWRERMYAVAARLDPDTLPRAGPGGLRRDGAGRHHLRRRVPLPAPRPRRRAVRRPERDGRRRWSQAAADAGIRITLLDTCYLAGGSSGRPPPLDGVAAAVRRRRRRRAGPSASPRSPDRPGRCGSARPSTRCGRCRPTQLAAVVAGRRAAGRCTCTSPSSRPRTRPASPYTAARPTAAARRRAACSARAPRPCTPPTSPTTTSRRSARPARRLRLPDHRARPGRRHRPGPPRCATPGSPAVPRQRQHAVIDLLEEARALELHERLRTERARPLPPGRAGRARHRRRARARSAGRTPGGSRPGARADLVAVRLDTPAHGRVARPARLVMAATRGRRAHRRRRRAGRSCATGGTVLGDVGAAAGRRRSRRSGRTHEHGGHRASASWSPTTSARRRLGLGSPTRRSSSTDGRRRLGRAGRRARPPPTRRSTSAGAAVIPGFVDSHAHLVFAGDRAAEFAARMAGAPYTGGGIRTTVAATRAATDDELRAPPAPPGRRDARARAPPPSRSRAGTGSTVADEARALRLAARGHRRRPPSSARTSCPPSTPTRDGLRRPGHRRRCSTACAPYARWIDVFCEPRRRSTATRRGRCSTAGRAAGLRPAGARQPAPAGPGRAARRRAGRGQRRPLHPPDRRRRRRAGRRRTRWPRCCPASSSPPARPTRTPAACSTPGSTVALATDCNPGSLLTPRRCRSASRSPSARCG